MKISKLLHAKSLCSYQLNERTTEYGTIIFDDDMEGNISNSFIWREGTDDNGHIDFYIDQNNGNLNSIWLVSLKVKMLSEDMSLKMKHADEYKTPLVNLNHWEEIKTTSQWPKIDSVRPIELIHNGKDIVKISFGEIQKTICLNDNIHIFMDENMGLSGLIMSNSTTIPLLIEKLK